MAGVVAFGYGFVSSCDPSRLTLDDTTHSTALLSRQTTGAKLPGSDAAWLASLAGSGAGYQLGIVRACSAKLVDRRQNPRVHALNFSGCCCSDGPVSVIPTCLAYDYTRYRIRIV